MKREDGDSRGGAHRVGHAYLALDPPLARAGRAPVRRSGAHATRPPRRACTGRGCYNRVVTIRHRRRAGLLRRRPRPVDDAARRGRRLPLLRGARRADARDPAEGPPARRVARLHPRPPAVLARGAAVRRRRPHEADHQRRRHQPDRRRPRRRRATLKAAAPTGVTRRHRASATTCAAARDRAAACPTDALFANAYLGARPIVDALAQGADIVITGRVADASLFLAPLVHEHGWAWDDWDRLAAGILVGHLLECSGQITGGNYSGDWWAQPRPVRSPFPIAEVEADGTRGDHEAAGSRAAWSLRHPAPAAALRGARPGALPVPRRRRRLHVGHARRPRRRPVRVSGARGAPPPRPYKGLVSRPRAGRARRASPSRGPTPRPRRAPRSRSSSGRAEQRRPRGRGVARGVLRRRRVRRADRRA